MLTLKTQLNTAIFSVVLAPDGFPRISSIRRMGSNSIVLNWDVCIVCYNGRLDLSYVVQFGFQFGRTV